MKTRTFVAAGLATVALAGCYYPYGYYPAGGYYAATPVAPAATDPNYPAPAYNTAPAYVAPAYPAYYPAYPAPAYYPAYGGWWGPSVSLGFRFGGGGYWGDTADAGAAGTAIVERGERELPARLARARAIAAAPPCVA